MANNTTAGSQFIDNDFGVLETSSYYCAWIMIGFCTVGLFGNVLSICVFSTKKMRACPINILCIALSSTDFLLLLSAGPLMALPPILASQNYGHNSLTIVFVNYSVVYLYPVAMMLQTASVWICSLISVERFLAVCRPLMVKIYCTVRRSIIALAFVFAFSLLYNLVRFWEFQIVFFCTVNYSNQSYTYAREVCSRSKLRVSSVALLKAEKQYLLWFVTVAYNITHLIPIMIICILNAYVIFTIAKLKKSRKKLTTMQTTEHRTAIMMAIVIVNFVLSYTLTFFLNIYEAVDPMVFERPKTADLAYLLTDISNTLVIFNSACTFLIYIIFSQKYRATALQLFGYQAENSTKNSLLRDFLTSIAALFTMARFTERINSGGTAPRHQSAFFRRKFTSCVLEEPARKRRTRSTPELMLTSDEHTQCAMTKSCVLRNYRNDSSPKLLLASKGSRESIVNSVIPETEISPLLSGLSMNELTSGNVIVRKHSENSCKELDDDDSGHDGRACSRNSGSRLSSPERGTYV